MEAFNLTPYVPSTFILMGIPGLEAAQLWISIPFSMFYIIGLLENVMLLFVVGKEQTVHKPMYLLFCMLALTLIATSTSIVPKALCIWFTLKTITVSCCLTQMFFLPMVSVMHSNILVIMAFDHYVAICNPLRYATILTKGRVAMLGLLGLIKSILFVLSLPLLLTWLPFCANRMIPHTYSEPIAVAKISCGDITVNSIYGLMILFLVIGLELSLIALSYGLIIKAILRISSNRAHPKAFNTCIAHICVILTYIPGFFSHLAHLFGQGIAPHVHIILCDLYLLIPPMLNPIIYGVKTKDLCEKLGKYTCRR